MVPVQVSSNAAKLNLKNVDGLVVESQWRPLAAFAATCKIMQNGKHANIDNSAIRHNAQKARSGFVR